MVSVLSWTSPSLRWPLVWPGRVWVSSWPRSRTQSPGRGGWRRGPWASSWGWRCLNQSWSYALLVWRLWETLQTQFIWWRKANIAFICRKIIIFNLDSWQIRWIIKVDLRKIHLWAPRSAVSGQTRGSWWAERSRCGSGSACSGPAEATSLGPPYDGSSCRSLPLPYCPSTPDRGDDGELVSQCDDRNT